MLEILIFLLVVSVGLYLFAKIPFPPPFAWAKQAIVILVVVLALLYVLDGYGFFAGRVWHGHGR